jgi:hypothetical protein
VTFPTAFSSNGIDATTGDYLLPAGSIADFAAGAADWAPAGADASELRARRHRTTERFYAPVHGVDVRDIAQAGWAVVFAEEADPAVRDALQPVLQQRRQLAGARYRELAGTTGYRAGETKQAFLRRLGIGSSPVDPDALPYYLLLVGPPDEIPFEVQYQLGVQYAVGRLAFDDVDAYRRYAANVVTAESAARAPRSTRLVLFGPRHEGDEPTAHGRRVYIAGASGAPFVVYLNDDELRTVAQSRVARQISREECLRYVAPAGSCPGG